MLDGRWKTSIERGLKPVGIKLRRAGVNADVLTGAGVVMAAASGVAIATGHLSLGLLLLVLTGLPDALDGAVARQGQPTDAGGFLDIALDFLFYASIPLAFALAVLAIVLIGKRMPVA